MSNAVSSTVVAGLSHTGSAGWMSPDVASPTGPAPRYSLEIERGFQAGAVFAFRGGCANIGTHHSNDIQLHEPSVSSLHCEVFCRGSEVYVRDLRSLNGTYVDGVRVREARLQSGDQLRIGSVVIRFRLH